MIIKKLTTYFLYILIFLLPFQTRYIYEYGYLNGGIWEYGTFSIFGTQILIWLIIILFAFYKFRQKELWQITFSKAHLKKHYCRLFFIIIFLVFNFFNVWLSINFDIAYQHWLWVLAGICLAIVLIENHKAKRINVVMILWLSGLVQAILAIYQFFVQKVFASKWLGMAMQNPKDGGVSVIAFGNERYLRAYGSFGWPNSLGAFLAVCLLVGLVLIIQSKRLNISYKIFLTVGQLFILTGLILSFSRGAWLATIISVIVLLFLISKKSKLILLEQIFYYFILFLIFVIVLAPLFNARFNLNNQVEMTSYTEHIQQYFEATKIIKINNIWDKNLWFGLGQGTYTLNLYNYNKSLASWQYQPAHNIYILWLTELGIIGFFLYSFVGLLVLISIWQYNRLFIPVILVMLIHGLFDHWWWTLHTGILIWWVVLAIISKISFQR